MPIYTYRCKKRGCKKLYDYFHNTSADKRAQCPHCGSKDGEKQITAAHGVVNGASAKNNYGLKR